MKRILTILFICLFSVMTATATVVQSNAVQVKQSDGKTLTVTPYGDERVTWYRTIDGYTLMIARNHDFVYAVKDADGQMKASDVIAHNPEDRTEGEKQFVRLLQKKIFYSEGQVNLMKQYIDANIDYTKKIQKLKASGDDVEDYKMVVILMSYSDYPFTTPKQDVENLFNQVGYSKDGHPGSVHDFFDASSNGKLNLTATVLGPYVSDSVQSYYGQSDGSTNDLHVRDLIKEAVQKADDDIDFSLYTNGDPNGYVSCVYVIYAGYSQASNINYPDLIWPHRSVIYPPMVVDNVKIQDYGCSSELEGAVGYNQPMKIGTICHEFSHVLGQPDYYDTNYELQGNAFNPGTWDLMAGGNYNGGSAFPPLWHAMERTVRNYVTIEDGALNTDYTLEDLSKGAKAIRLRYDGLPNEYFLLENRQQSGFDSYLPGHGLIIYKIDRNVEGWNYNCANCDTSRLGFELITANGSTHHYNAWNGGYSFGQNQPFPGSTNNTSFTDATDPSSKSYYGENLGLPIFRIYENETTKNITFHIGDTNAYINIYDAGVSYEMDAVKFTAKMNAYSNTITEKGFLYSTESAPVESNSNKVLDNSSSSTVIDVDLTLLVPNTEYFIRPYAKTANKISYGEIIRITTPCQSINIFPYEQYFTNGVEDCWTQENFTYIYNNWKPNDDGNMYIASDYAWITSYYAPQPVMKLITPPLNTTVLDSPMVVFSHKQKSSANRTDNLQVYYRTSLTDDWVLLKEYKNQIANWQTDTLLLPVKSQTLYIGFEACLKAGDGVYLDDVVVTDNNVASWPQVSFSSIKSITDNGATFKASVTSVGFTNLLNKGFVLSENPLPTIDDIVVAANDTASGIYELTSVGLLPSTQYHVRAFAQNQGMISYSTEKTFITKCAKIKDFPYTPDLSSLDTICFDMDDKLILPIFDLSYKDSMVVIYNATRNTTDNAVYNIGVYYRDGVDGEWELINSTTEPNNQTITVDIPTANHQSENAYIAFSYMGLSSGSYLLNSVTVKAVSQIAFVQTDSVSLPSYNQMYVEGSISYEGMTAVTQRGFVYSKTKNPTVADNKVNVGSGVGNFNTVVSNLEPLTTYYVRAFATNSYGTSYGNTMKITTPFIPIFNNTVSADQHLCAGSVPVILNGSTPTGGNGEYEYLWISSTDGITWDSCDEGSINNAQLYEPRQLFKTTYYRRVVTSYVSVDTSDMVTITIDPSSKGGNVFAMQQTVKQNEPVQLQLRAYVGNILYWERLRPGYDWAEVENTADMEYFTDEPEDIGEYSYRATVKSGVCNAATSGTDVVVVEKGVGLENVDKNFTVTISPNPATNEVYICVGKDLIGKQVNVTIIDSKGEKFFSDNILLNSEKNLIITDNISVGTYIVTIKGDSVYKNLKLIIAR